MLISKKMLYEAVLEVSRTTLWRKMSLYRSELEEDLFQKRLLSVNEVVIICSFFDITKKQVIKKLKKLGKV